MQAIMRDMVVVLPGIMGSTLAKDGSLVWAPSAGAVLRKPVDQREAPHDDPDACANFLPVPYDWRLSNQFNGKRLKGIVEPALESGVGRAASSATPRSSSSVIRWVASSPAGISTRRAARRSPAS